MLQGHCIGHRNHPGLQWELQTAFPFCAVTLSACIADTITYWDCKTEVSSHWKKKITKNPWKKSSIGECHFTALCLGAGTDWPARRFSRIFFHSRSQALVVESFNCSLRDLLSRNLADLLLDVIVNPTALLHLTWECSSSDRAMKVPGGGGIHQQAGVPCSALCSQHFFKA